MSGLVWQASAAVATAEDGYHCEVRCHEALWHSYVTGAVCRVRSGFSTEAEARAWCEARVKEGRDG